MLEWLAAATGAELSKLILDQVLNLGKAALEDYVKDFFKDCIQTGVAQANAETLKQPMAAAVGFLVKRFVKELQFNDVPETSIEHHYKAAIKRFVQDKAVRPILGKAFEKDCKQIDFARLQQIWAQTHQTAGWRFPEEFDWRGVAKEYVLEVKGIIRANAELRAILDTELLEEIARNTAQLSPGFDVARYRASLQASYGYLKLSTIDTTDQQYRVKLWNLFIEQTVREALPPMRYELPLDLKRQMQEQGQLDALSPEALEHYRREYFQQPSRQVLEAVAETQRAVILGDPGAGKSTLLQYLALDWVEGKTETLPLLIELREYVLAQSVNFLEFLHRGRGADWQFDQQQLHQHLLEYPTLVMFDGLDEVFDRATQAAVTDDIIRFAQQHPKARILVTSRIIGYKPDRFQHAEFRQFTIQPLDEAEIHEFIERWYDLAVDSDADKTRLKQRLKDAITHSKAIQNLADNPLLLTMMAILNRRQELPRDRADLYDQASRVLLYHWDVDHKRLNLKEDTIGRREKQEMLRLIAYEMQAGDAGLKGNLISAEQLTRILTTYLRDQGFNEPREKAARLIDQLRERNFILCYRGADTYGFMHRTFLEYFCAVEIVNRFEKQRTISFEQLRDEIFGQHWQDETWHEVLRLICGMIDAKFAGELIEFLMTREVDRTQFLGISDRRFPNYKRLKKEAIMNLLLAVDCWAEIRASNTFPSLASQLLHFLKYEIQAQSDVGLHWHTAGLIFNTIARYYRNDPETLPWLRNHAQNGQTDSDRMAAVRAIAKFYWDDPETPQLMRNIARNDRDGDVRWIAAVEVIAKYYRDDSETLALLCHLATNDEDEYARFAAVEALNKYYWNAPQVFELLCNVATRDLFIRKEDWESNPRQAALGALLNHYPSNPKTLELLRDRAINDPDEQLREWAQEQLSRMSNGE